ITGMYKSFTITLSDKINTIRSTFRDDNLIVMPCMNECLYFPTCDLKCICRNLGQVMYPAMHIAVHISVVMCDGIDNLLRFLCCRTIIQIHQRPTIYLPTQ